VALRDDVRAGNGTDAALNARIVAALKPTHVGRAPDLTGSWDDLIGFMNTLPGVRWRMGHTRLGVSPGGETLQFEVAITINDGAVRFPPVERSDLPGNADEKRAVIQAILIAKGL